jgi:hypothetical protein
MMLDVVGTPVPLRASRCTWCAPCTSRAYRCTVVPHSGLDDCALLTHHVRDPSASWTSPSPDHA